eukprot:3202935-Amphidinium_carterae.2
MAVGSIPLNHTTGVVAAVSWETSSKLTYPLPGCWQSTMPLWLPVRCTMSESLLPTVKERR